LRKPSFYLLVLAAALVCYIIIVRGELAYRAEAMIHSARTDRSLCPVGVDVTAIS
jgi:hypothetical protein